jgi:hypothetical protein
MTSKVSDQYVASCIISFVESGSYPESDDIATSDLSSQTPTLLKVVSAAEEAAKVRTTSYSYSDLRHATVMR